MKILLSLCLIVFGFLSVSAQEERYVKPVDEAKTDASFLAFRTKLIAAAKKRDAKYILSIVDPNIRNTFGDDDGIRYFKKVWKIENPKSKFWDEFLKVITNGGDFTFSDDNKIFYAPYTFNGFPADIDSFDYSAIFGNNVNLRADPDPKSKPVARLSYNIVRVDYQNSVKKSGSEDEYTWLKIETLGGKKGFVSAEYVRSPIDYRAGFQKRKGVWKLMVFVAGD
jgi:hypothetical protein